MPETRGKYEFFWKAISRVDWGEYQTGFTEQNKIPHRELGWDD